MSIIFEINESQINKNISVDTLQEWDSLNHMKLIIAVEEEFNIEFNDEEIVENISYSEIKNTIMKKIKNKL